MPKIVDIVLIVMLIFVGIILLNIMFNPDPYEGFGLTNGACNQNWPPCDPHILPTVTPAP